MTNMQPALPAGNFPNVGGLSIAGSTKNSLGGLAGRDTPETMANIPLGGANVATIATLAVGTPKQYSDVLHQAIAAEPPNYGVVAAIYGASLRAATEARRFSSDAYNYQEIARKALSFLEPTSL